MTTQSKVVIETRTPEIAINEDAFKSLIDFIKTTYGITQNKFGREYCGYSGEQLSNLKKKRTKCKLVTKNAIIGGISKLMEEVLFYEQEPEDIKPLIAQKEFEPQTLDDLLKLINREDFFELIKAKKRGRQNG